MYKCKQFANFNYTKDKYIVNNLLILLFKVDFCR